jgi:3-phenylpropionate/cinnamic acid dioxygenase small subunit
LPYDVNDLAARVEIEELIYLHSWLLDHGRGEEITGLYTEDGMMIGVGPDRIGRDGILGYARARKPSRTARHVCTNVRIEKIDDMRMTSAFMITLYRSDEQPPSDATPIAIADIDDVYRRDVDGRWRIAKRQISIVFEAPAHRRQQAAASA